MNETARKGMRLADGGQIDRSKPLQFTFNGKRCTGYEGDTLASALLANGIRVVARSFKYHRPRGIFSAGEEEPCALVETGVGARRTPTCRAPLVRLHEGLVANSQNCWPGVTLDAGRMADFTHALWPAGFYNKTFKWPSWHAWEGLIRRSAGLGRPLTDKDPDRYEQVNAHCDLLICGAGPAGLVAAQTAGRAGLRVLLVDQDAGGGSLNWEQYRIGGQSAMSWVEQTLSELASMPNVQFLPFTTVSGIYDQNVTTLLQSGAGRSWRECLWTVRPRHVLLATGAIEQGLIFPHNDRPGIMLAGAVRHYLNRYAVQPGRQVVVATNNDTAYQTVFDLAQRQVAVSVVVDQRDTVDEQLRQRLSKLGTRLLTRARIGTTRGRLALRRVRIEGLDGSDLGTRDCDLLAVSGGWSPRLHLLAHARGALRFDDRSQSFLPATLPGGVSVAGCANGISELQQVLAESVSETVSLCRTLGCDADGVELPEILDSIVESLFVDAMQPDISRSRQWIDLAHDVTMGDARLAVREGFVSVEHFKRYTTTGMSVDQGKTGNLNALIVLGALTGKTPGEVGTTTFRPPYMPMTLGALAGRNTGEFYAPLRYLPAHRAHQRLAARFEDYGWLRPDYYLQDGETPDQAIRREVLAVREKVGVFDNSPIGKLEVYGPDAAVFLDRIYLNDVTSLRAGRCRYVLMLNDNGVIIDDGVISRLSGDRFLVNTTSAGVDRVRKSMDEWLQREWRGLKLVVEDVTACWANFTVAGPRSLQVLRTLGVETKPAVTSLPHMAVCTGSIAGVEARIVRVSFSGECSYEINVPARHGEAFLDTLLKAGAEHGISPYGVEALMVLRLEKGYLHIGSDTDGSSTPDDVGWGAVARRAGNDFVGRRSLSRPGNLDRGRKQLVGLEPLDPGQSLRPGSHLLLGRDRKPPARTDGWITSACFSPTLNRHIGLAVLSDGREHGGEIVSVCDEGSRYHARIVPTPFYDPENQRLNPNDESDTAPETHSAEPDEVALAKPASNVREAAVFSGSLMRIVEQPDTALYRLRRLPGHNEHPGAEPRLPRQVGDCSGDDPAVLCLGPGEWLLKGASEPTRAAAAHMGGDSHATLEVSDGFTLLRLSGPASAWLLNKLGGLDFQSARRHGEHCARTKMQHLEVIVHYHPQLTGDGVFDLLVERSLARYFFRLMVASVPHAEELNREYGEQL